MTRSDAAQRSRRALKQFSEQPLRLRKLLVIDLRRPQSVHVEIGRIGNIGFVLHKPIVHLLDEERVVAEIADAPLGKAHQLAMAGGEILLPFQAERRLQVMRIPALLDGSGIFEIVDIEADIIDDIVARIDAIRGDFLRAPARTPVDLEVARVPPEYRDDTSERGDKISLLAL